MAGNCAAAVPAAATAGAAPMEVPEFMQVMEALAAGPRKESLTESIKRLKDQQTMMKLAKKNLQKELKNARERKQRLKQRARQLTDLDLVEVLNMRKDCTPMVLGEEPPAAAAAGVVNAVGGRMTE